MSSMDKRISKLEWSRGGGGDDRLFIVFTIFEPSSDGPYEHEPIGLSSLCARGAFFPRLPGESVEAMHARATLERPDVPVWVTRYERDEMETVPKQPPLNSTNSGTDCMG